MNLQVLQTLISIIDSGSLVKAAKQLHVTQSTITARLQLLESDCGQQLVIRQKSGVIPTAAGLKVLQYARTIVGLWKQAKVETIFADGVESLCRLYCAPTLWEPCGKRLFDLLSHHYPTMAFLVSNEVPLEPNYNLSNGLNRLQLFDLVIDYEIPEMPHHQCQLLVTDQIKLYASKENAKSIGELEYVYVDYGAEYMHQHHAEFAEVGVAKMTFSDPRIAIEYAKKHLVTLYLPTKFGQAQVENGVLFEIADAIQFSRDVYLSINQLSVAKWQWFPTNAEIV